MLTDVELQVMPLESDRTPLNAEGAAEGGDDGGGAKDDGDRNARWRRRAVVFGVAAVLALGVIATVLILAFTRSPAGTPTAEPLRVANAAVASEERTCSQIGSAILTGRNGNAVDAVIATALCIGVINNFASGIGGGGFMLVQKPGSAPKFYDFREKAPASAYETMYIDHPTGGLASGVPGELKGMDLAHRNYGRAAWTDLFEPSIDLARNGFAATPLLVKRLTDYNVQNLCDADEKWRKVYCPGPDGKIVTVGDIIRREDLANTLEAIARNGSSDPFYFGAIAAQLVDDINAAGGNMTVRDFANYTAVVREPARTFYHGSEVLTGAAPSSGPVLVNILNILEGYRLGESAARGGPTTLDYHHIVEAMKYGFAQRSFLGDPDYVDIAATLAAMVSKELASQQRANISDSQTFPPEHYGSDYDSPPTPGTTHISALDKDGFAAAMTSTVNLVWGSKVMSRTGVLLNNQMDDFSTPNKTNSFGLAPSPNNFIRPGKRPMSSSVPTIVRYNGKVQMVVGASGGSRIITSTLLTLINYLDLKMNVQQAVNFPRLHHQLYPNEVQAEYNHTVSMLDGLAAIGHVIDRLPPGNYPAAVQAVTNGFDGYLYAASDPRKDGLAAGY